MTAESRLLTIEEFSRRSFGEPVELVDGEIRRRNAGMEDHSARQSELLIALGTDVRARRLGRVLVAPGVIIPSRPYTLRIPDIAFVSLARWPGPPKPEYLSVAPELAVDVLDKADSWQEIRRKADDFFSVGVERVWTIDGDRRVISVYRSPDDFTELRDGDILRGEGILDGFELPVTELFDR